MDVAVCAGGDACTYRIACNADRNADIYTDRNADCADKYSRAGSDKYCVTANANANARP